MTLDTCPVSHTGGAFSLWFPSVDAYVDQPAAWLRKNHQAPMGLPVPGQLGTSVSPSGRSELACAEQRARRPRPVTMAVHYPDVPPPVSRRTPGTDTTVSALEGSGAPSFQRDSRTSHLKRRQGTELVPGASPRLWPSSGDSSRSPASSPASCCHGIESSFRLSCHHPGLHCVFPFSLRVICKTKYIGEIELCDV